MHLLQLFQPVLREHELQDLRVRQIVVVFIISEHMPTLNLGHKAPQFHLWSYVNQAIVRCTVQPDFTLTWSAAVCRVVRSLLDERQFEILEQEARPEDSICEAELIDLYFSVEELCVFASFDRCSVRLQCGSYQPSASGLRPQKTVVSVYRPTSSDERN